ncbi:GNS1/SUR4 family protein [Necator americanus]|uniref:Elongation of very long chain fatty acids protein n=1 Tax=Necator americanus TaxID=51031 RepID=W2SIH2_NECAM|nr:GNS1/SUR4 family protein [Necator americanus]ETN69358.1 GNS1/SUR4 family protein [Necator americanus]
MSLCSASDPHDVAAFWILLFTLSKVTLQHFQVVELGDTLFIVLRKKPLIFLHYYHHAAVLIYALHSGRKYLKCSENKQTEIQFVPAAEHSNPGRTFVFMNYFAHSCMYTYFALTVFGVRVPRWISMSVTIIQTIQMLAGVAITFIIYRVKTEEWMPYGGELGEKVISSCQQSMGNLYLAFVLYTTFAALFLHFFYQAYIVKSKRKTRTE